MIKKSMKDYKDNAVCGVSVTRLMKHLPAELNDLTEWPINLWDN